MTPRGGRGRLAIVGLGLALALGIVAPRAPAAPPARSRLIYHKSRSFRIPFNVDPSERSRLKEVQLWVSLDAGFTWKRESVAFPDRPSFTFRAPRDGEYWFAVRTLDTQGRLYPGDDEQVEPKLKVVVDTKPPSLILEPDARRGSVASVRWEAQDENLDLTSLVLEYQAEGAGDWGKVRIRRRALLGSETWDAGTAEPIKVRALVADKAGNTSEATINLPEGTPNNPGIATNDLSDFSAPPPISQISSGPGFPPVDQNPAGPEPRETFPGASQADRGNAPAAGDADAFGGAAGMPNPAPPDGGASKGNRTILVANPQFPLQYAIDDAGPNGPNVVELWVTQDGGRTWSRRGEDPDRTSPIVVDLGGEGTFGVNLVARSAAGLGDQAPAPGDAPQIWVEVDSTPPSVQLFPPLVGTGRHTGKVAITWRATDLHLGPRPVVLLWRPDQAGARWQPIADAVENTGKYIWTVPANFPPKFHLRIEVTDTVGNTGSADTSDAGPIIVDRTRPRSRILGLDPSARTGAAPSGRSLR